MLHTLSKDFSLESGGRSDVRSARSNAARTRDQRDLDDSLDVKYYKNRELFYSFGRESCLKLLPRRWKCNFKVDFYTLQSVTHETQSRYDRRAFDSKREECSVKGMEMIGWKVRILRSIHSSATFAKSYNRTYTVPRYTASKRMNF